MAWNDPTELNVPGDGQAYFAPVGTTLPAENSDPTAALAAAFVGAGYISEDGATLSVGSEVEDFMAWQSKQPVRRSKQTQDISVAFAMMQLNEENLPFAFGGGSVSSAGGRFTYRFPEAEDSLDERSLVLDTTDGDVHYRFVIARGTVSEAVETQFTKSAVSLLPVTFKALKPLSGRTAYVITDAPGFAAGS